MQTHLTVKGIVIRESAVGETDKMLLLLTEDGLLHVRAKSVRKPGSKYAAVTQMFSYAEFCLRVSGEWYYLDSAVPAEMFFGLRSLPEAAALASYFAEVMRKISTQQPQPELLHLFLRSLYYLQKAARPCLLVKAVFELRLCAEMGLMPDLSCCGGCAGEEPEQLFLRPLEADFLCAECAGEAAQPQQQMFAANRSVLRAARFILEADEQRVFDFRLGEENLRLLARYTENYLQVQTDLRFQTLPYFYIISGEAPLCDR